MLKQVPKELTETFGIVLITRINHWLRDLRPIRNINFTVYQLISFQNSFSFEIPLKPDFGFAPEHREVFAI